MSWQESLSEKISAYSKSDFNYFESSDIEEASKLDLGCTGIYMEASVVYFEIKNIGYLLKEIGRRKVAQAYTMCNEVLTSIAEQTGGFVNCFSSNAFLIIYPGKEESLKRAVTGALKVTFALTDAYKHDFSVIPGFEFAMGLDHGHIMGTKNVSDTSYEHISWFGALIYKAMRICKECARPFYVGISGSIYHNLGENYRVSERRILGIKKKVEIWTKVTYQYENVRKHLYQTNHKFSLDE